MTTSVKEKPAAAAEEAPAKGGKKKLMIILVVVVLALGAGAYFFLFSGSSKPAAPQPGLVLTVDPVAVNLAGAGVPDTRMSAAGYADTQPLVPYTNPNAMALNRRVDIVVLSTASPEANDQLAALDAAAQKGTK